MRRTVGGRVMSLIRPAMASFKPYQVSVDGYRARVWTFGEALREAKGFEGNAIVTRRGRIVAVRFGGLK